MLIRQLDSVGGKRKEHFLTFVCVLEATNYASICFQDAFSQLRDVLNELDVQL